jgi:hypothetical protein
MDVKKTLLYDFGGFYTWRCSSAARTWLFCNPSCLNKVSILPVKKTYAFGLYVQLWDTSMTKDGLSYNYY